MRWVAPILLMGCGREEPAGPMADPGRVTLRRLTRAEYDNTVRDLFLTSQRPAAAFPADDFGEFSRIASSLSVSSVHVDLYLQAAEDLLEEISSTRTLPVQTVRAEAELGRGAGFVGAEGVRNVWMSGDLTVDLPVPETGSWTLTVIGESISGGALTVSVDGVALPTALGAPVELELSAGEHLVALGLANPDPDAVEIPMLLLDAVELSGPLGVPVPPGPGRERIFVCDPQEVGEALCAEDIVRTFTRRAWRRNPTAEELTGLFTLYGNARGLGEDWEGAVLTSLQAALLAPWFTYIVEIDPAPTSLEPRPLNAFELATRLSYFLWSSMPDDELLDLAETGALGRTEVIEEQVDRMLRDPKARALVETLASEWLYLDLVEDAAPSPEAFPEWDEGLRAAMKEELHLFTANILLNDRSMLELVTGTETFVDARLARHYGVDAPAVMGFAPVNLEDRAGIIGRAGWLTSLSYPSRTSPVRRGKWVVENLVCVTIPDPPANVKPLPDQPDDGTAVTARDQLEQHRQDPTCMSCHVVMDGVGFGLENYDGIGIWRDTDAGWPIDTSATLPNPAAPEVYGKPFDGPGELATGLAAEPAVPACMVRHVFTFALARDDRDEKVVPNDVAFLDLIETEFRNSGFRFSALARAIATSDAFRYRTGEPEVTP